MIEIIPYVPEAFTAYSFAETGLRVFRVVCLLFGIISVNSILHGGFFYMVAGTRDKDQTVAWDSITKGIMGSVVVIVIFSVTTVMIQTIGERGWG